MKIAFIHLTFTWPPRGGAGVDCFEICKRLARDHQVRLFVPTFQYLFKRFRASEPLPFDVETIPFEVWNYSTANVKRSFRERVLAFAPDVLIVGDAWTMKPHLINAFPDIPVISRYYAYESLCLIRNGQLFRKGAFCPNHLLKDARLCRVCAMQWVAQTVIGRKKEDYAKIHEFLMAGAWLPSYVGEVKKSLDTAKKIIVYNQILSNILYPWRKKIVQMPSGPGFEITKDLLAGPIPQAVLDSSWFKQIERPRKNNKKIILVPGRLDDPAKGISFARAIGKKLALSRSDFVMAFTGTASDHQPHEVFLGWVPGPQMPYLYRTSDVVFIPSLWPEPHGIVAVEAMEFDLPVISFAVGGLGDLVEKYSQGLVLDSSNRFEIDIKIQQLLDTVTPERSLTEKKEKNAYSWERIFQEDLLRQVFSFVN